MFKSKTLLTLALLTSMVSLTACGQKSSQSTPASSQSKVVQSSSSSSLSKAKTTTSTEVADTENASSESSVTSTAVTTAEEEASSLSVTTTFDLQAIDAGDFSTLEGTWANAKGQTVVIEGDKLFFLNEGELDPNHYHLIESQSLNETGRVGASIGYYNNGERQGGAHLSIVPAGVENNLGEISDLDHLEMGHVPKSADSGEHFFRQ